MQDAVSRTEEEISKLLKQYFERKESLPPSQWVQKFIRLTHRQSIHKGLYSLRRTPYFKEVYDCIIDPEVRMVSFMKSAQVGYSQLLANLCFYLICNRTNPIGIIFPSQSLAQQWSERCLHNGMESCAPLQDFMTGDCDDIRRSEFTFTSCNLKVIGGGSANKLSSNNICYLFIDEADKLEDFNTEAAVIELAIDRTITYQETKDAKIFMGSTPTLAGASEIEKHYEEGSQSKYLVPCPHCQHEQELVFQQVKWPDCKEDNAYDLGKVEKMAHYECIHCKKAIDESEKSSMINMGRWVATNDKAPKDLKSYHISALYSLSVSWGYIARQFLISKNDRSRLQNFHNSILGLPWTPHLSNVTPEALTEIIRTSPEYNKGFLPAKTKALVMGCDTQQDSQYFSILAILESDRVALVDWGQTISWEDLYRVSQTQYHISGDMDVMGIYGAFIDAGGNRTGQVYDFCQQGGNLFVPVFGRTEAQKLYSPLRRGTINVKGRPLDVINVHDRMFSENMLLNHLRPTGNDMLYLPKDADDGFLLKQLADVTLIEKKDAKGFVRQELKTSGNNHYFDCVKYALAMRYMIAPLLVDEPKEAPKEEVPENEDEHANNYEGW